MARIPTPTKTHGGKYYLASKIVALFPPHLHYCEPYFGGGSVLLARNPQDVSEVVNDLSQDLTTFWRVLQCPVQFPRFMRHCEATPFSEDSFRVAGSALEQEQSNEAYRAWAFFVRCRQSLAGRGVAFTSITRKRLRRGMNAEVSAWLSAVEGLPLVHARLKRVLIVGPKDALEVIRQQDGPDTLHYLDPPYLHETRSSVGEYEHEMTDAQHQTLLDVLGGLKGKFLLSGYRSAMYDAAADRSGWRRHEIQVPNNAAGGKTKKRMTECVWANF